MTPKDTQKVYLTINQFAEKYNFVTADSLRWHIKTNKQFEKECIRRFGRRILIDEEKTLKFIEKTPYNK